MRSPARSLARSAARASRHRNRTDNIAAATPSDSGTDSIADNHGWAGSSRHLVRVDGRHTGARARSPHTGLHVALKRQTDAFRNRTDATRTVREALALRELRECANVVTMLEVLPAANGRDVYLVFELLPTDLHDAIASRLLEPVHRQYIAAQLVSTLTHAHGIGLMHRDLKPANLLLTVGCELKVADWGLARTAFGALERAESAGVGAAARQSCEQVQGVLDRGGATALATDDDRRAFTEYVQTRWWRAPEILWLQQRPGGHRRQRNQSNRSAAAGIHATSSSSGASEKSKAASVGGGGHACGGGALRHANESTGAGEDRNAKCPYSAPYTPSIDMYAAGCIIAEMYLGKPLFRARNGREQLEMLAGAALAIEEMAQHDAEIAAAIGHPTPSDYPSTRVTSSTSSSSVIMASSPDTTGAAGSLPSPEDIAGASPPPTGEGVRRQEEEQGEASDCRRFGSRAAEAGARSIYLAMAAMPAAGDTTAVQTRRFFGGAGGHRRHSTANKCHQGCQPPAQGVRGLVAQLLSWEATRRPSAAACLHHPFLAKFTESARNDMAAAAAAAAAADAPANGESVVALPPDGEPSGSAIHSGSRGAQPQEGACRGRRHYHSSTHHSRDTHYQQSAFSRLLACGTMCPAATGSPDDSSPERTSSPTDCGANHAALPVARAERGQGEPDQSVACRSPAHTTTAKPLAARWCAGIFRALDVAPKSHVATYKGLMYELMGSGALVEPGYNSALLEAKRERMAAAAAARSLRETAAVAPAAVAAANDAAVSMDIDDTPMLQRHESIAPTQESTLAAFAALQSSASSELGTQPHETRRADRPTLVRSGSLSESLAVALGNASGNGLHRNRSLSSKEASWMSALAAERDASRVAHLAAGG